MTHDIDEAIKMGDLVAVMEAGGRLAQSGTPDEILAHPASDFVARFVGADRGLKRLALTRIDALELGPAPTVPLGTDVAMARAQLAGEPDDRAYLLLVDAAGRPIGWIGRQHLPPSGTLEAAAAAPMSPLFDRRTTLKDALSMLVDTDVQTGIVLDDFGAVRGLVTAEMILGPRRGRDPRET